MQTDLITSVKKTSFFTGIHIYFKFSPSNRNVLGIIFGKSRSKGQEKGKLFFCFCQSLLSAWGHGLQAPFNHFCSSPLSISSLPPYAASRSRPSMGGGNVTAGVSADLGFAWKWFTPKLQNLHLSFTVWKLFRYEVSVLLLWHFQRRYLAVKQISSTLWPSDQPWKHQQFWLKFLNISLITSFITLLPVARCDQSIPLVSVCVCWRGWGGN